MIIGLTSTVFANGPGDQSSIPGRVIPKTQKMVLDAALLNTQHYKVWIKGKVAQSWEWSSTHPYSCRPRLPNTLAASLQRDKILSPNEYTGYDTKQSDGEVPVLLELWGMCCTSSLRLLPVHSGLEW